jgi:hypothetical protein
MLVKMAQLFRDVRVGIDLFEAGVLLEAKELAELVECTAIPSSSLLHTENLNRAQCFGDVARTEAT